MSETANTFRANNGTKYMKIDQIKIGRRIKKISQLKELEANIQQVGIIDPITIDKDNNLIAGERRLEACRNLGMEEVPVRVIETDNPLLVSFSTDTQRVGLLPSEIVEYARELEMVEKAKAKQRQLLGVKADPEQKGDVRDKVSKVFGISAKNFERAKKVIEVANRYPDEPEAQQARKFMDEKRGLCKAHSMAVRLEKHKGLKHVDLDAKLFEIHHKDFRKVDWQPASLDLVFTDPPWGDYEIYEDVARVAAHALKPDAYCMVYCGSMFLPQIIERMCKHLTYFWHHAIVFTGGGTKMLPCGLIHKHTNILMFANGQVSPNNPNLLRKLKGDDSFILESDGKKRNDYHKWQQALTPALFWIENCSQIGDTVADFTCGAGTFGVACKFLNRRYIGCDPDKASVMATRHRIATEEQRAPDTADAA